MYAQPRPCRGGRATSRERGGIGIAAGGKGEPPPPPPYTISDDDRGSPQTPGAGSAVGLGRRSVGLEPHESPTTPPHRRDGRTRCRPADASCRLHRTSDTGRGSPPRAGSEEGLSAAQQSGMRRHSSSTRSPLRRDGRSRSRPVRARPTPPLAPPRSPCAAPPPLRAGSSAYCQIATFERSACAPHVTRAQESLRQSSTVY